MAVVGILQKHTSPDPQLTHLLRCFILYAAVYNFTYIMEHVAGNVNKAADAISRNICECISWECLRVNVWGIFFLIRLAFRISQKEFYNSEHSSLPAEM